MRIILLTYITLLITITTHGQMLRGTVIDGETTKPLYTATITNLSTEESVTTDALGNYTISAKNGDTLSFAFSGYRTKRTKALLGKALNVDLVPLSVKLPEFVLHEYTPYQKDSIEMTRLYSKELNAKAIKPGFSSANGGGFSGLIGGPVQKMSRSYKQNKRFKENFQRDMEQRFIDTRYTAALVTTLTGMTGDTLIFFMNTHPMDYDFARHATDLELKMWIRETYRAYLKQQQPVIQKNK